MGNTVVDDARSALGPVGTFLPITFGGAPPADQQRDAIGRLERAGYRAAWVNEGVGGKDALVQAGMLLAASERMTLGTGIANMWARAPQTLHGGAVLLAQAYPGRFVLGIGVGYPSQAESVGRDYGSPLATIRDYVTGMTAPTMMPAPDVAYPKVIASNGPKMLTLAGEIGDGALPTMLPPEFTEHARKVLGPDKLLIVGLSVIVDGDREAARQVVSGRLTRPGLANTKSLALVGYSEQDIAEPSDRLVDALIGYGDPKAIAAKVSEHRAAGADHVTILPTIRDYESGVEQLEKLAPALAEIA